MPGAKKKVIGISEDDACADLFKVARGHRLYGCLGADRHEAWSINDAVGSVELAETRTGVLIGFNEFVVYGRVHIFCILT